MTKQTNQARVKMFLGTTGSGKTWGMYEQLKSQHRVFLFDLMAESRFDDYGIIVDNCQDALHLALKTEKFRIRLQFDQEERFNFLCSLCVKKPHGQGVFQNVLIAVDEISMFCSPYYMPEQLKNVIRLGRHTNTMFWATTQRVPDIHPLIWSQCKEWYLYQMHLPRDVDYLKKIVPDAERVKTLQVGECILWTPQSQIPTTPTE